MNNPWTFENWNLTDQGQVLVKEGLVKAQKLAAEAGTSIGGKRPANPNPGSVTINKTYIFRKTFAGGGTGFSSGDGPPA